MSMELMVKAMKIKVGNPLRKLVLLKLADNASDRGECWPSYQHIAEQCEVSRRAVMVHIDALCKAGLVRKEARFGGPKGNSSNIYVLTLESAHSSTPGSESRAPGVEQEVHQGGEGDSLGGGEGDSPRTSHSLEPVIEPKPMCKSDSAEGFELFWKLYPNKKGRKDALKVWNKLKPDAELQTTLMTALGQHRVSRDWTKDNGQFIPMAATWLNGERWNDELQPASGARQASNFVNLPQHNAEDYADGRF